MKVILSEKQFKNIIKYNIINEASFLPVPKKANKPYSIDPDKVLIVKKFLDNGFKRGSFDIIGPNGMPNSIRIVAMLSNNGTVLKNMYLNQVLDLLIDKFQKMFTDETERKLFLSQVLNDWFDNKIGTFGTLSVNHL